MFLTPALFKGQLYLYHISNSAGFSQALLLGATAYSSVSFRYFLVGISKEKNFSHITRILLSHLINLTKLLKMNLHFIIFLLRLCNLVCEYQQGTDGTILVF